jgi:hypothetical protein
MLQPKARGPLWFSDQLRSRSSSLSWPHPCPQSSWWREWLSRWLLTLSARYWASMVFRASRLGPRRLLTADAVTRLPPHTLDVGKEPDLGCGKMVLLPAHAQSAGARPSSRLVVLPPPRATHLAVGALVAPRRSPPLGSRAAAWPQRQGSAIPVGRAEVLCIGICVDVRALVGASVIVACRPSRWR